MVIYLGWRLITQNSEFSLNVKALFCQFHPIRSNQMAVLGYTAQAKVIFSWIHDHCWIYSKDVFCFKLQEMLLQSTLLRLKPEEYRCTTWLLLQYDHKDSNSHQMQKLHDINLDPGQEGIVCTHSLEHWSTNSGSYTCLLYCLRWAWV